MSGKVEREGVSPIPTLLLPAARSRWVLSRYYCLDLAQNNREAVNCKHDW